MLNISDKRQLGELIERNPRIFYQRLESFPQKFDMLMNALIQERKKTGDTLCMEQSGGIAASIFINNPSLLSTTNRKLQARIEKCLRNKHTLSTALRPSGKGRKRLFSNDEKSDSGSTIYLNPQPFKPQNIYRTHEEITSAHGWTNFIDVGSFDLFKENSSKVSIIVFVSASTFPSENMNAVRGKRKAGGIALQFPQKCQNDKVQTEQFILATKKSFGTIMPEESVGSSLMNGLILTGFPFLRPSRNRCDLYACHGALKVVLQFLKLAAAEKQMNNVDVDVQICSDSSYSWKILNDIDHLLRLGALPSIELYENDGSGPKSLANPDLLYPLAKTLMRLVSSEVKNEQGEHISIGNTITVQFRYSGEVLSDRTTGYIESLNQCARKAAKWQFDKLF